MKTYGFGVDIGGTTVKLGLFRTDGELLDKWEIPTRKENDGSQILPDVAASIKEKIAEKAIAADDVQGIGVGVPGPVTPEGIVRKCVNLGWGVFNVEDALSELTGYPVKAGNDANVAALGELWQGAGKGAKNIVMVTLGTGIGGGVIIDGRIVAGSTGAGGEIGHLPVNDEETLTCGCGKKGCLEQYASATGVVTLTKRALEASDQPSSLRDLSEITAKDLFDAAKAEDALAQEVLEQFGSILGKGLATIACVVNPEMFVIGGGVSKAGTIITDVVEKYYTPNTFHACREAQFKLAELGNDAGIYGCVKMIL
ncbi:MAG: ROK family glucokinase [bacterium]|nr:ROK family glucokinase [bacterium]MDY4099459.1 ROK family glucokinase [Lachnospiraceae bacterium]